MNRQERFDRYIAPRYPETMQKAKTRLVDAPNLCGLGCYDAIGAEETMGLLLLILDGGWVHGVLPALADVALFLERNQEFTQRFGGYPISELAALLADAIKREDRGAISAACEALKHPTPIADSSDRGF